MSEPTAPYSPRRPLRFRVWDGERMLYDDGDLVSPDDGRFYFLALFGEVKSIPQGTWPGKVEAHDDFVVMQSTGLRDADGREVYEGDVLEGEPWSFADPDPLRCIVRREAWAFVLENGPAHDRDPEGTLKFIREARVVGNVYEPSPEPEGRPEGRPAS